MEFFGEESRENFFEKHKMKMTWWGSDLLWWVTPQFVCVTELRVSVGPTSQVNPTSSLPSLEFPLSIYHPPSSRASPARVSHSKNKIFFFK